MKLIADFKWLRWKSTW